MASSQPQPYVYADSEDSLPSKLICAVCHDVCGTHSACPGCNQTFCEVSHMSCTHVYISICSVARCNCHARQLELPMGGRFPHMCNILSPDDMLMQHGCCTYLLSVLALFTACCCPPHPRYACTSGSTCSVPQAPTAPAPTAAASSNTQTSPTIQPYSSSWSSSQSFAPTHQPAAPA
jgi:hypothetical protein